MDLERSIGFRQQDNRDEEKDRQKLQLYINLKLASSGQPIVAGDN